MDISSLKDTLIAQLQSKVGLDEEKAKQATDVVVKLVSEQGPALLAGAKDKLPAGIGGALGGMLGKK